MRYRDKDAAPFRALQFDGTNIEEAVLFARTAAYMVDGKLHLWEKYDEDMVPLEAGDWIVACDEEDHYLRYDPQEFEKDFEKVLTKEFVVETIDLHLREVMVELLGEASDEHERNGTSFADALVAGIMEEIEQCALEEE